MTLSELMRGLPISEGGCGGRGWDLEVEGISHDSRRIEAGDLFVAWRGGRHDGHAFVEQAVARGACAVLASEPAKGERPVPWFLTPDPHALLGPLAARLYRHPDRELLMVGITGTNGKSTVTELVARMLESAGRRCGRIGTLGYVLGKDRWPAERTTPEASDLCRTLRGMRERGGEAVTMEVSSHALALGRVGELRFDVAAFTNLTRDHFDYHRDFEDYFAAKRRLFDLRKAGGRAVVSLEDRFGERLAAELDGAIRVGTGGEVEVQECALDERGIRGELRTPRGPFAFESRLLGSYNLRNLMTAVGVGEALELDHAAMAGAIAGLEPIVGRLEPVGGGSRFPVYVDYAHTPGALEAALRSLRELSSRKIVLVFGCGGERDPGKRPLMGRIAGELSELPILTNDNPRGEDPSRINAAVEGGLRASGNPHYRIIPDRREAIRRALAVAASRKDFSVLVAGKGHEAVQIVDGVEHPFSDRLEIERGLEELRGQETAD